MLSKLSALFPDDENYVALLDDLKIRIRSAQMKAALNNFRNPIAIAEHKLPEVLPSAERLESELENAVRLIEREGEILEVEAQSDDSSAAPEKLTEVALEVQRLLKLLHETKSTASREEQQAFAIAAMPLTMQQQAVIALQSLGKAAVKELLDDAYADTTIAMMEYWRD